MCVFLAFSSKLYSMEPGELLNEWMSAYLTAKIDKLVHVLQLQWKQGHKALSQVYNGNGDAPQGEVRSCWACFKLKQPQKGCQLRTTQRFVSVRLRFLAFLPDANQLPGGSRQVRLVCPLSGNWPETESPAKPLQTQEGCFPNSWFSLKATSLQIACPPQCTFVCLRWCAVLRPTTTAWTPAIRFVDMHASTAIWSGFRWWRSTTEEERLA